MPGWEWGHPLLMGQLHTSHGMTSALTSICSALSAKMFLAWDDDTVSRGGATPISPFLPLCVWEGGYMNAWVHLRILRAKME